MKFEIPDVAATVGAKETTSGRPKKNCQRQKKLRRQRRGSNNSKKNRARHRLLSIQHDVHNFVVPLLENYLLPLFGVRSDRSLAVIANERCGSWYLPPPKIDKDDNSFKRKQQQQQKRHSSCYFKSTDGHVGTWGFSLKRLNLHVINVAATSSCVVILDASRSKELPDSFSRTIPMWCVVLNRIAARYRRELGMVTAVTAATTTATTNADADAEELYPLHTPSWAISPEEHATMEEMVDQRVQELYDSQAIVDPVKLASMLTIPLRPFWLSPQRLQLPSDVLKDVQNNDNGNQKFHAIVCLSCSDHSKHMDTCSTITTGRCGGVPYFYTPGAADDEESWARNLDARLFWQNADKILRMHSENNNNNIIDATGKLQISDEHVEANDRTDQIIDEVVERERQNNQASDDPAKTGMDTTATATQEGNNTFDMIGNLNIGIGSRRSGRPDQCWQHFDAILNVTDTEYAGVVKEEVGDSDNSRRRFYLQIPVKEGKRDRTELERWLAPACLFCLVHAVHGQRRVLIHCAQGKDRSVAVTMAVVVLFCDLKYPLQWKSELKALSVNDLKSMMKCVPRTGARSSSLEAGEDNTGLDGGSKNLDLKRNASSGISLDLIQGLLGRSGRDIFLNWLLLLKNKDKGEQTNLSNTCPLLTSLATKQTLRMALHLVKQDREKADPTRSTMQKLNRFFMSGDYDNRKQC